MKLCINEYNIESVNAKSKSMAEIARKLLANGAPLHCIGTCAALVEASLLSDLLFPQALNRISSVDPPPRTFPPP
jgi:endo-1,4-beta-xylanase